VIGTEALVHKPNLLCLASDLLKLRAAGRKNDASRATGKAVAGYCGLCGLSRVHGLLMLSTSLQSPLEAVSRGLPARFRCLNTRFGVCHRPQVYGKLEKLRSCLLVMQTNLQGLIALGS
jgi:hypothetical protein